MLTNSLSREFCEDGEVYRKRSTTTTKEERESKMLLMMEICGRA